MKKNKTKSSPEKKYLTISKVVKNLKKVYPDLSSSKLRFLESEGLLSPKRSSNKYRIYFKEDLEKINFILKMQREFYMPLEVIKQKLKSREYKKFIDGNSAPIENIQIKLGEEFKTDHEPELLSVSELSKKFKLPQSYINEFIGNDIVNWKEENGKYLINTDDMEILNIVSKLSKYGIHVKHLKLFENFANRSSAFIQQIILPLLMSNKKEEHSRALKTTNKLEIMLCDFQEILIKKLNRKFLEKHK
jgi:DNA-binding transcriptional MerR regulator